MSRIFSRRFSTCLRVLLPVMLAGCAGQHIAFPAPPATELASVPFYPQDQYQCGPAALATVLDWSGTDVNMASLVSSVYVPGRQGSLQPEMIAAARRAGRIPYTLPPQPAALSAELAAGNPVLVLQNLGLNSLPRWHYAVVVGYDPGDDVFILRSGVEKSRRESVQRFMSSWQRAGYWGLVVLQPGQVPASRVVAEPVALALANAEALLSPGAAVRAWEGLMVRWPDDADVLFGTANALRRKGDDSAAGNTYLALLQRHPDHIAARNNFADLLLQAGCAEQARTVMRGIQEDTLAPPLSLAVSDTRRKINEDMRRPRGDGSAVSCKRWRSGSIVPLRPE
ncbi:MAG: PA2778 family cysteine peptidase [Chromatocurvus sp.]